MKEQHSKNWYVLVPWLKHTDILLNVGENKLHFLFLLFGLVWFFGGFFFLVGLHPHILALCYYYIFLHRLEDFFVV